MYLYMGRLRLLSTDEQKKVTLTIKTNATSINTIANTYSEDALSCCVS